MEYAIGPLPVDDVKCGCERKLVVLLFAVLPLFDMRQGLPYLFSWNKPMPKYIVVPVIHFVKMEQGWKAHNILVTNNTSALRIRMLRENNSYQTNTKKQDARYLCKV